MNIEDWLVKIAHAEDEKWFKNGWHALQTSAGWMLSDASGDKVINDVEDFFVYPNGWFSARTSIGWTLYTAFGEEVVSGVDDMYAYDNGWFIVKTLANPDWVAYDPSGKRIYGERG